MYSGKGKLYHSHRKVIYSHLLTAKHCAAFIPAISFMRKFRCLSQFPLCAVFYQPCKSHRIILPGVLIILPVSIPTFKSCCDTAPVAITTIPHHRRAKMKGLFSPMMFRIEPLPHSSTNVPAAGRTLNRPIITNPLKTSIQKVPTEAAAQPEYSLWHLQEEFTHFSRAEPVAPALFPFCRHSLIRSPQGINTRSRHGSCHPPHSSSGAATAPASATRLRATGDRWQRCCFLQTCSTNLLLQGISLAWTAEGCQGILRELPLFSPAAAALLNQPPIPPCPATDCPWKIPGNQ